MNRVGSDTRTLCDVDGMNTDKGCTSITDRISYRRWTVKMVELISYCNQ